jgi:hypothetical protein
MKLTPGIVFEKALEAAPDKGPGVRSLTRFLELLTGAKLTEQSVDKWVRGIRRWPFWFTRHVPKICQHLGVERRDWDELYSLTREQIVEREAAHEAR